MSPDRWRKIESVFQVAVELPVHERDEFIKSECGPDDSLRREVELLLTSDDSASDFIESPVWTDSAFLNTTAKKEISNSLDDQLGDGSRDNYLGRQIGAYRLTREIGRGGMGAVYLADRADGEFHQRVAIKLIKRGMDSDFIIRRFRHERQILASFEHPFIARLLDGGTTGDSVPYFVMEYIEGETLYKYCDSKRLGVRDRLKIFQKICSAIEYAHEKQIIHRDIKPSNILINNHGSPKLLDFGIAKILDPNLIHESINPTASMLRMMTPDYASPEQVQGGDVTPSSDIYSLGVLLYELLTGHRPYNFAGRALHEVSHVICEVMPEVPSKTIGSGDALLPQYATSKDRFLDVRSTTRAELEKELAAGLDDIVMKAIAKVPAERYVSAKEFSRDISRFLQGTKIEAPKYRSQGVQKSYQNLRAPENSKAVAVLPFKFLNLGSNGDTDDRFLGIGLADALITRLSRVRRFVVRPTSSILSFADDLVDPIKAGRDLNVDFILDGNIKKAGKRLRVTVQLLNVADNAAVWATSVDETVSDVLTLEDTLANKVVEVLLPQLTGSELQEFAKRGTEVPEAFEHYLRGRYYFNSFTEEGLAKAFVSFHSAVAEDPDYALAYAGIADYYNWLGIMGVLPPQECFQPAIEAASQAVELDEELSEAHASLGFSLHAGNYDWSRAEHHLRRAIELSPNNANAYVWYSIVLFTEGRFNEGLEFARRGTDLDPLTPFNHHNIGWGLYFARRYDEAIVQYRKVVSDFPSYSFGYLGLSKIHRLTGDTRAALEENDKFKQLMGGSMFSLLSEAECYAADGQAETARQKIAELEKLSESRYVSPYQLSLAYCFLGDKDKAIECLEKAGEIKEAWLNWLGVEPAFDPIRKDARFARVLEGTGYLMFFHSVAPTGPDKHAGNGTGKTKIHDLTTLVLRGADKRSVGLGKTPRIPLYAIAAALLVLAAVAVYVAVAYFSGPGHPATLARTTGFQNPSIVITPFDDSNSGIDGLGVGLADALTNKLGNIKALHVISSNTGRSVGQLSPQTMQSELGVAFLVRGTLDRDGEGTRLNAEMISTTDGSVLWSEEFMGARGDLFGLETRVAERIWSSLGIQPLTLERQQVNKGYTQSNSAYQLYLIGRSLMANRSRDNLRRAIETFGRSAEEDPKFALPYVGMSDAYSLLNLYDVQPPPDGYAKARENALKALAIDDNLAEAHASLAYIKFYHERDRTGAELEYRRAIQLNPSYAQAHHWFALALAATNHPAEALTEAQIAQRLDPRSAAIRSATGMVYFMNSRYAEALSECERALVIDPSFVPALKVKRWVHTVVGNRDAALSTFQKELTYSGGKTEDPGWKIIEVQMVPPYGDRTAPLAELEYAIGSSSVRGNDFAFAYEIALAYNALGQEDKCFQWLDRARMAGSHGFNFLEVDPRLANLHGDSRFQKLATALR